MTSLERDYAPEQLNSEQNNPLFPSSHEISVLVNGFVIGVLLLGITNLHKWIANLKETE